MDFSQNYFQLFGLEERFELESSELTSRYRELQKALHPDRFANASDQERRLSLQQAAQINSAYNTLRDPLSRARYLITLFNSDFNDETSTISDPEFLEEQMELRELLGEIPQANDAIAELAGFIKQLKVREKEYVDALKESFSSSDNMNLEQAKALVQRMQFMRKLLQEAEILEEELLA